MESKRSVRDFNYNHSDIFLAIIILTIAALIIAWRIDIIMDYPSTLDPDNIASLAPAESNDTGTQDTVEKTSTSGTQKAIWTGNHISSDMTVKLEGKSQEDDIQALLDAGLFVNRMDFRNTCKEASVDPEKTLRKGTLTFTQGMTKTDIAKALTKK